jgi:hypothetical protein
MKRGIAMKGNILQKKIKITLAVLSFVYMIFGFTITQGLAVVYRPPNPVMDYVPQNIGIKDKLYSDFTELECRKCHGESTAELHHHTPAALYGDCFISAGGCHAGSPITPPGSDCKICHTSDPNVYPEFYAVWGDLGDPHHKSDAAASWQCNLCHSPDYVVEAYSVPPPTWQPTSFTPTPASCENCHFWDDSVNPIIHGIGHIENWGPTDNGMNPLKLALGFDPYNLPSMGTHEEINGMVYSQCALCHWGLPGNQWDTNPYNPYAIRFCEKCHTMDQLHNNPEHVNTNNIYTVNGVPNQEITSSAKCMACHGISYSDIITLLLPNGGEVLPSGGRYAICWEAPSNAVKFDLSYSTNNGITWNYIKSVIGLHRTHWEEVPVITANKKKCRVRVTGYDSNSALVGANISDKPFTIEVVRVTSPNGGETLTSGNTETIQWTTNKTIRPLAKTVLKYTTDGTTWKVMKRLSGDPEIYSWTVPDVSSTKCKVKVILKDAGGANVGTDTSDKFFTIQP